MHVLNIGVPRTATVYIQERLSNVRKPHRHWHLTGSDWSHVAFEKVPDEYFDDFILGVVRNPFDLLVSNFALLHRMDVLMHHYDRDLAGLEFRDWLTLIAHRRGRYPLRYPLHFQLFRPDWSLGVDYLARFETLDADLTEVARLTGGEFTPAEPANTAPRNKDWRAYYDPRMREMVEDAWYADLSYFGYSFDGYDDDRAKTTFGLKPRPLSRIRPQVPDVPWLDEGSMNPGVPSVTDGEESRG